MLPDIWDYIIFAMCGKAETGSAGVQPERDNHNYRISGEDPHRPHSVSKTYSGNLCLLKLYFLTFCPFYAGAVQ